VSYIREIVKAERREMEEWEVKLDKQLDRAARSKSALDAFLEGDDATDDDQETERDDGEKAVEKAIATVKKIGRQHGGGAQELASAIVEHLHDKLRRLREARSARRTTKRKEETTMKTREEHLRDIAKNVGVIKVCKDIVGAGDAWGITEAELVDMIGKHDPKPGESQAQTFARHYEANIELRKAVQIAKAFPMQVTLEPRFVGHREAEDVNDPEDALAQINELVEQQRKASPGLTTAQLFARVYAANPQLAAAERRQNRPGYFYPVAKPEDGKFYGHPGPDERRRVRG
jgi:hypothetical protein